MDGFLQQPTVDLIKLIRGEEGSIVHQNIFRPYEGINVEMMISNTDLQIQQTIFARLSKYKTLNERCIVNVLSRTIAQRIEIWCRSKGISSVCMHGDDIK